MKLSKFKPKYVEFIDQQGDEILFNLFFKSPQESFILLL